MNSKKVGIMFDASHNNEKCIRLRNMLNNEIVFKTGANVVDVELGYNISNNKWWIGIVVIKSCMACELVKDYMLKVFGLRHLRIDESVHRLLRNDRILYSGLSRDELIDIDVLCRMKGY